MLFQRQGLLGTKPGNEFLLIDLAPDGYFAQNISKCTFCYYISIFIIFFIASSIVGSPVHPVATFHCEHFEKVGAGLHRF